MAKDIIEIFNELAEAYILAFPKEEDPRSYTDAFGFQGIIDILKEADGRQVVFVEGNGEDEVSFSF